VSLIQRSEQEETESSVRCLLFALCNRVVIRMLWEKKMSASIVNFGRLTTSLLF